VRWPISTPACPGRHRHAKALDAVVDSYSGESKNARAAVYIGDGRSAAHLLETDEFEKLTGRLADARIPVSSYAVGLRLDPQLLGSLAVQSGGTVILGGEARAEKRDVLWRRRPMRPCCGRPRSRGPPR